LCPVGATVHLSDKKFSKHTRYYTLPFWKELLVGKKTAQAVEQILHRPKPCAQHGGPKHKGGLKIANQFFFGLQ
jgi:hypothetical protein